MAANVSIGEHFKRLFDFSGREDRVSFWPYAALAFGIVITLSMILMVPMIAETMGQMQRFAAENPDQATITRSPGHYSISVRGEHPPFFDAGSILLYLGVTFGSAILLFAAAVVRRLRDAGLSGLWGLLPLPFIAFSSVQMTRMLGGSTAERSEDLTPFFMLFLSNVLYLVSLSVLIALLALRSKPAQ